MVGNAYRSGHRGEMFRPIGMFDFLMYGYIRDKMISLGLKEVWLGGNDEDNEGKLLMYKVRVY